MEPFWRGFHPVIWVVFCVLQCPAHFTFRLQILHFVGIKLMWLGGGSFLSVHTSVSGTDE